MSYFDLRLVSIELAKSAGLSTVMRDAGTMVMFAGTPYAHLHICGSPWKEMNIGEAMAVFGR